MQNKKETSEKEKVVPIHHQVNKQEVSFNKSFSKPASNETSFNKSFQRKRVYENSVQIMNNNEIKMPDLKSLIKTKDFYNRQQISDALQDSEVDYFGEKSNITGDLGTQIFSTKFDRSNEITLRH